MIKGKESTMSRVEGKWGFRLPKEKINLVIKPAKLGQYRQAISSMDWLEN